MTLSRLTNYVDGNILTGAQLNNEFDNILNNGPSLVSFPIPTYTAVAGLTGSLISNIGSFQANAYQLKSTSGTCYLNATSSYSINTQTAGPTVNGRDQVAAFASTDVHFYAITTGGTSTVAAGIASSNPPPTGPTLPTGYSAWAYLASAKYTVGSSAMPLQGTIRGSQYLYSTFSPPTNGTILSLGGATTLTSAVGATSTEIAANLTPTIATQMNVLIYQCGGQANSAGNLGVSQYVCSGSSGPLMAVGNATVLNSNNGVEVRPGGWNVRIPVLTTPPGVYYKNTITVGTSASLYLSLVGYTVPNGDVG